MYLKSVNIRNIRSITDFKMEFSEYPGWHVLIGDNGSGKSSIIRSIALGLIGSQEIQGIKPNWNEWLRWKATSGFIQIDMIQERGGKSKESVQLTLNRSGEQVIIDDGSTAQTKGLNLNNGPKVFSAGYGPFRRFTGGSYERAEVYNNPSFRRLAAHLSLFGEDVALSEATTWLIHLQFQTLEKSVRKDVLANVMTFINSEDFLPHKSKLKKITSQGVIFVDGNGSEITVNQMSDGYRSILSLTFELLRQMVASYGADQVFENVSNGEMVIDLPGIVLIDEIDAHLHPTWQTRIGEWFIKYFPKIQFIMTTHSPLICRAAENGSIWRLRAPGSDELSGEITGLEKEQIVFGNVLDAYGTEVFGKSPVRSEKSDEKRDRLGKLNMLSALGKITSDEEKERLHLQKVLKTDDPVSL